jgi:hypothetical protein
MNWYKESKDFEPRNIINHKIIYLKGVREKLSRIADIVFQSAKTAKNTNFDILSSKKMSSYPTLKDMLSIADSIVYDSPWKFSSLCKRAVEEIDNKIYTLKKERDEFTFPNKNNVRKGWI